LSKLSLLSTNVLLARILARGDHAMRFTSVQLLSHLLTLNVSKILRRQHSSARTAN